MMVEEAQGNVANFIAKLWKMLNHSTTVDIMHWDSSGKSFIIENQISFISKLLPMYFKHTNMGSFIRQLNLYDFHKIGMDKHRGLEYQQKYFQKDRPTLLKFIKRKLPKEKRAEYTTFEREQLDKLSEEVILLKNEQEASEVKLGELQRENLTLLRQMSHLHSKHNTQTQVLRKIIELLIPFVDSYNNAKNTTNIDNNGTKILGIDPKLVEKLETINNNNWREMSSTLTASNDNLQLCAPQSDLDCETNFPDLRNLLTSTNLPPVLQETAKGLVELYDDSNDESSEIQGNISEALNYLDKDLYSLITDSVMMDCNLEETGEASESKVQC